MSNVLIPFILFGEDDGIMWPKGNREGKPDLLDTVGWDPLAALPCNNLRNTGYCRCGKGIMVFHWPENIMLHIQAKTILRCHDQHGACCKFRVSLLKNIQTYGGLLLAVSDESILLQRDLMDRLDEGWIEKILQREKELNDQFIKESILASIAGS
ncbi:MAG: hypothetical protein UW94_C0003G0117 [Parcubacteria group bacterium GW2011_GWA2_45_14]|nr:MAG: hypothetical protein UW94_C0003G0117 [Parcubacteria group bacterium GW2011_GWA2_45_14]